MRPRSKFSFALVDKKDNDWREDLRLFTKTMKPVCTVSISAGDRFDVLKVKQNVSNLGRWTPARVLRNGGGIFNVNLTN
jgi:hypothetical protein